MPNRDIEGCLRDFIRNNRGKISPLSRMGLSNSMLCTFNLNPKLGPDRLRSLVRKLGIRFFHQHDFFVSPSSRLKRTKIDVNERDKTLYGPHARRKRIRTTSMSLLKSFLSIEAFSPYRWLRRPVCTPRETMKNNEEKETQKERIGTGRLM